MVVADCEINVQSYIPYRAPVARRSPPQPQDTHTHIHYTSPTAPPAAPVTSEIAAQRTSQALQYSCKCTFYVGRDCRLYLNVETGCSRWFQGWKGGGGGGVSGQGEVFHRVLEKCCLTLLAGATFLVLKVLKTGLPLSFFPLALRKKGPVKALTRLSLFYLLKY